MTGKVITGRTTATPIGEGAGAWVAGACTAVATFVSTHGGEIAEWLQENGSQAAQLVQNVTAFLGIGPGYNAANGGEVYRQLGSTNPVQQGTPLGNAYCEWLKTYHPYTWNTGNIWENNEANFSTFRARYLALVAAGMRDGSLVDRDMVPLGLEAAYAAVQDLSDILADETGGTRPNVGPGTLLNPGNGGSTPPPPPPNTAGNNTVPLALAAALAFILLKN